VSIIAVKKRFYIITRKSPNKTTLPTMGNFMASSLERTSISPGFTMFSSRSFSERWHPRYMIRTLVIYQWLIKQQWEKKIADFSIEREIETDSTMQDKLLTTVTTKLTGAGTLIK
jgi:hypothetical protein